MTLCFQLHRAVVENRDERLHVTMLGKPASPRLEAGAGCGHVLGLHLWRCPATSRRQGCHPSHAQQLPCSPGSLSLSHTSCPRRQSLGQRVSLCCWLAGRLCGWRRAAGRALRPGWAIGWAGCARGLVLVSIGLASGHRGS